MARLSLMILLAIGVYLATVITAQNTSTQSCQMYDAQCLVDVITHHNNHEMELLNQIRNDMRDEIVDEIARNRITCNTGSSDLSNCPVGGEETRPRNCWEWRQAGSAQDGIYTIYPYKHEPIEVFCDMHTTGGGWTVFQRRQDGSVDFNRTWNEYRDGFGDLAGEHWLGNKHIHALAYELNELRVEIGDWNDDTRYQRYYDFYVSSEDQLFKLNIGGYSGSAGNSLGYHNQQYFSTFDMDNDNDVDGHCASKYSSGFWFNNCFQVNLNAPYRFSSSVEEDTFGIVWYNWLRYSYSLKTTEMKMRPRSDF